MNETEKLCALFVLEDEDLARALIPPDSPKSLDEFDDVLMGLRVSLCFPALTQLERSIVLIAWEVARALTLAVNTDRSTLSEGEASQFEEQCRQIEQDYMCHSHEAELLVTKGRLTEAQATLLKTKILAVPIRERPE